MMINKSKIRVSQPGLRDCLKNNPEADFNTVHVLQQHKNLISQGQSCKEFGVMAHVENSSFICKLAI